MRCLLLLLTASALPLAASPVFNLVSDFSATTNPNGVWSYGYSSTPNGSFTPFAFTDHDTTPAVDYWQHDLSSSGFPNYYPLLRYNASGADINNGNGFIFPVDMVSLDPSTSFLAGVRFTAPTTDFYDFSGEFQGLQTCCGGPTRTVYAFDGPTELVDVFLQNYAATSFSFGLQLTAGDVVDFRVQAGGDGAGDSTGLSLAVTESSDTPEPNTLALFATAATALFFRRFARR